VPEPVKVLVPHVIALTVADTDAPVPLRLTVAVGAVLEIVNWPVTEVAVVGAYWTVNTVACPGFNVRGKFPPETENPAPVIESELMVTATVPLEVTVIDFDTDVLVVTLPKASVVALRLNAGVAAFSCIAKLLDDEFAPAVIVAVCEELTEATFAVNEAVDAPEATLTLPGTTTALLLLARATAIPVDGAGALKVIVQPVELAPVKEPLAQASELTVGKVFDDVLLTFIEAVFVTVPCVAVSVTVCSEVVGDTFASKLALRAPEGTVMEAGTETMPLLLASVTANPVAGAPPVNVTVQVSVPAPVIDVLAQLKPESEASLDPLPCNLIELDWVFEALTGEMLASGVGPADALLVESTLVASTVS
jgi:hypothetical protein